MLVRDEEDVIAEVLSNHVKFCSHILVLDGTTGPGREATEDIAKSFSQVVGYWTDEQTGLDLPIRDGGRQFLLSVARGLWGFGQWYAVLHGDEIWTVDPRTLLHQLPRGSHGGAGQLFHFFPHVSQKTSWNYEPGIGSIERECVYYMTPGVREERFFFDDGTCDYDVTRHSKVIPSGIEAAMVDLKIKQYNYRSPAQAHERAVERAGAAWQANHYRHLIEDDSGFFLETLEDREHHWAASVPVGEGSVRRAAPADFPAI